MLKHNKNQAKKSLSPGKAPRLQSGGVSASRDLFDNAPVYTKAATEAAER